MRSFPISKKIPATSRVRRSEEVLLERVRKRCQGWELARSRLLEIHEDSIFRRCLQRLDNVQDAEDAMQETMLRALDGFRGFQGRSALRTWLFSVADNECSSMVRRQRRHRPSDQVRPQIQIYEKHQRRLVSQDGERAHRVRRTLARLPSKSREVLALRFFGESSLDEIARTLDIGLSAAKMRLYRALNQFAEIHAEID